jgi:hypothetical protein
MRQGEEDSDENEGKSVSYNDTSNIYQIHKILTSDQYTLGRNVTAYLEGFHQQYRSLLESAEMLPQPVSGYRKLNIIA